jgi:uncharacterized protein YuzE
MKITYDKSVNALYFYLRPEAANPKKNRGIVAKTKGSWPVHLDFSKEGQLLGIEIMDADHLVNISYIKKLKFINMYTKKEK